MAEPSDGCSRSWRRRPSGVRNEARDRAVEVQLAAISQLRQPHSDGHAYVQRKLAEGRTKKEAIRSLKRHISNAIYRQLRADAQRATQ